MPCPPEFIERFRAAFPEGTRIFYEPETEYYDEAFVARFIPGDDRSFAIHVIGPDQNEIFTARVYGANKVRHEIGVTKSFDEAIELLCGALGQAHPPRAMTHTMRR